MDAVLARRDEVVHGLDDSTQVPWLEERGVTLVRGHGRLDGERRVRVGDDVLVARQRGRRRDGQFRDDPSGPGPHRRAAVDEHRGNHREAGPAPALRSRRWRRRGRDGAGVVVARVAGHARPSRRPPDRARGAVRGGSGGGGAPCGRGRRPARDGGERGRTERRRPRRARGRERRGGRDPRRDRQDAAHRGHRARYARHRAGRSPAGRRLAARPGARDVALRGRRRQRPCPAHAHGEVPGATRGGLHPRQGRAAPLGRGRVAAGDLHRPAGRRRRADARRRERGGPALSAPSTSRRAGTRAARSSGAGRRAPRGSSSTSSAGSSSARRSPARRSPRRCTRRRSPSSGRCRSRISGTRCHRSRRAPSSGCACSRSTGCSGVTRAGRCPAPQHGTPTECRPGNLLSR